MPQNMTPVSIRRTSPLEAPAPLPPLVHNEFRALVGRLSPPIEPGRTDYALAAGDAPSAEFRDVLSHRVALLDLRFAPAGHGVAAQAVQTLLDAGMAMRGDEPGAADRWAALAVKDLLDLPAFALVAACRDLRRGFVGDGKWLPEPGVIRTVAQRKVHELARERREIRAVLDARVEAPTRDRRAELIAAATDWTRDMRDAAAAERRGRMTAREIADAKAVSELMRTGTDPRPAPVLSPYLRGKLGLGPDVVDGDGPQAVPDMVPDWVSGTMDAA